MKSLRLTTEKGSHSVSPYEDRRYTGNTVTVVAFSHMKRFGNSDGCLFICINPVADVVQTRCALTMMGKALHR